MSMSTFVYGIIPADKKWKEMKTAFDACESAGIDVPSEIWSFFDGERPDAKGVLVNLENDIATEYSDDSSSGFEVNLDKIDPNIKTIRFVNSW